MNTDLNERLKQYQRNYHASKNKKIICFYCIKMSEHTLKCGDIVVNKREFHASKQPVALNLVNTNKIVVSDKFKHSYDGFKYFIGYLHDHDVIRLLCIISLQMSGYIKCFDNGGKNMSFKIEDESVYLKYTEIWNKIKKSLGIKIYIQPIYDYKYIKTKVKTFSSMINTLFSGNEIPIENNHYICIAAICIDSILKVDKKNHPQVYLEQCKYKIKRREPVNFIDAKVGLSSDSLDDSDELDD